MNISILGCGWLGLPLAETLLDNSHTVKGSTTSESKLDRLKEKGIEAYLLRLNPGVECDDCRSFWESEVLVLNIPPGRGRDNLIDFHTRQIQSIIDALKLSSVKHLLFVSSTSVYPEQPGLVEEDDAKEGKAGRTSGNALLKAEAMFRKESAFKTTVVRFGGLYGYDRNPAKFLAGRKKLDRAKAPVNLIHRDDCVRILSQIIEEGIWGETFNAVSDGHPPRKMYYTAAAEKMGLQAPSFDRDEGEDYKVVSNRRLKNRLKYTFKYPNPMNFAG